ncbi:hypothetical protein AK830_g10259 [Neonectria ditissima]|uniref:BEACH domain-containing protein n=1 Tax=Neonectria ditissima TaxID=78410 RepID=A0A0N8H5J0_9HYPO|nr:hypothetical protein AK830_g10259 [Neonectria ditissima]
MIYGYSPNSTDAINGLNSEYFSQYKSLTGNNMIHGNIQDRIDPNLRTMGEIPMQQYLRDSHAPMFNVQSPHQYPIQAGHHDTISSLTLHSQGRHDSPIFQHQPSLISSAQSPRAESDLFYDGTQGPSTPHGMTSPYTRVCDPWDTELLTGLSSLAPNDGCVNPSDINPSHVRSDDLDEKGVCMELTLNQRHGFITSSPSTQHQEIEAAQHSLLRMSSPTNGVQHQDSLDAVYPDPETMDEIINSIEVANEPESYTAEGQVHTPAMAPCKPAPATKSPSRRGRPKRPAFPTMAGMSKVRKTAIAPSSRSGRKLPAASTTVHLCSKCDIYYKDAVTLSKHIRIAHNRVFACVLKFAGCDEAFASKNEWKRHAQAQHMNFHLWLCTHGSCGSFRADDDLITEPKLTHGRMFRRKDLFSQHVRRMHIFSSSSKKNKGGKHATPEEDEKLKKMQKQAFLERCKVPQHLNCPVSSCGHEFRGDGAWDGLMEHVAHHLDRAATGNEPPVQFGEDNKLIEWASSKDANVIYKDESGKWKIREPLTNVKVDLETLPTRAVPSCTTVVDEDAEGEDL